MAFKRGTTSNVIGRESASYEEVHGSLHAWDLEELSDFDPTEVTVQDDIVAVSESELERETEVV